MIIPAIIGYLCGNFQFGLLVATGTLASTFLKVRRDLSCEL